MDSNHRPYEDARAEQEFESFLGRPARIATVSNMWGPLVSAPQYLGATPDAKLAPGRRFELRTLRLTDRRSPFRNRGSIRRVPLSATTSHGLAPALL